MYKKVIFPVICSISLAIGPCLNIYAEAYTKQGTFKMEDTENTYTANWKFVSDAYTGVLTLIGNGSNMEVFSSTANEPWNDCIEDISTIEFVKIGAISKYAFKGYSSISKLVIDNKLWYIQEGAFQNCVKLETVTLPESVIRVHPKVFEGCTNLKDVYFTSAATFYSNTFDANTVIHYPENNEMYQNAKSWGCNIILDGSASETGTDIYAISDLDIELDLGGLKYYTYNSSAFTPAVKITDKYGKAINDNWYSVSYTNNINAGTGKIVITGDNIHIKGVSEKEFLIAPKNLDISDASLDKTSYAYIGREIKPSVTTSLPSSEYKLDYTNDLDAGKGTVKIEGKNNHSGSITFTYKINVPEILPGDADGDKQISVADALLIQQKIAGWNVEINMTAADVNKDEDISVSDVLLIQQFIAGWDVTLK